MTRQLADSDWADSVRIHTRHRVGWLVGVHLIVGLTLAFLTGEGPSRFGVAPIVGDVFAGIVFAQSVLLGVCGGLASVKLWQRVACVCIGASYNLLVLRLFYGRHTDLASVAGMSTGWAFVAASILHVFRVRIHAQWSPAPLAARIQFSISSVMFVTMIIACLAAIMRLMQFDYFGDWFDGLLMISSITIAVFGIIPVWPVLVGNRPALYGCGLIGVVTCAGYFTGTMWHPDAGMNIATTAAVEAMAATVSLLVIRSCGFQLTRATWRENSSRAPL